MRSQKSQNCDTEVLFIIEARSVLLLNVLGWLHKKNTNKQRFDDFLADGKLIKSLKKSAKICFTKNIK